MGYYQDLDEDRGWDAEIEREERERRYSNVSTREKAIAKNAGTLTRVICPGCAKPFLKKHWRQQFCSNKGKGNCKDLYHNVTNPRGVGRFREG